jgi:CDP-diglyceride synthetase
VIVVKDMLYAVVGLIAAALAAFFFYSYVSHKGPGDPGMMNFVLSIVCLLAALACGGLFLSGRVNRKEDIHITE